MFLERVRRLAAEPCRLGGGGILLAVLACLLAFLLYPSEPEAVQVGQRDAPAQSAPQHMQVKGSDRLIAKSELCDPFTTAHEAAGMAPSEVVAEGVETPSAAEAPQTPSAPVPPPQQESSQEAAESQTAPPAPQLRGILRSETGAVAILSVGGACTPVAVGGSVAGVRLMGIGSDAVSVEYGGAEMTLPLVR